MRRRLLARHALARRNVDVVVLIGGGRRRSVMLPRRQLVRTGKQRRRTLDRAGRRRPAPARFTRAGLASAYSSAPQPPIDCATRRTSLRAEMIDQRRKIAAVLGRIGPARQARSTAQSRDARRSRRCSGRGSAAPAATSSSDCRRARVRKPASGRCRWLHSRCGIRAGRGSRVALRRPEGKGEREGEWQYSDAVMADVEMADPENGGGPAVLPPSPLNISAGL